MNSIPQNLSISEQMDTFKVSFQGSLVKVKMVSRSQSVLDDHDYRVRKAFEQEYMAALWKGEFDHCKKVVVGGSIVGIEMSDRLRGLIESRAFERAAGVLENRGGKRGKITGFSRKSRKSFLEHFARLKRGTRGIFITLTYRENMIDYEKGKYHLDLVLRWLLRHYPGKAIVWRMEEQERGAVHFHLIVLGASFVDAVSFTAYWQGLTGDDSYPDIKRVKNRRQALGYVGKYVAKVGGAAQAALGLDDVPNLEMGSSFLGADYPEGRWETFEVVDRETGEIIPAAAEGRYVDESAGDAWMGRFWGIVGRQFMPYAPLTEHIYHARLRPMLDFRRAAARYWPGLLRRGSVLGFSLFTHDLRSWLRYWLFLADGLSPMGEG